MGTFRRITVDGKAFLWHYGFDDYDCQLPSLLVIKCAASGEKIILQFPTDQWGHGICPFNQGHPASLNGVNTTVNLNHPDTISRIIAHLMKTEKLPYPFQ